MSEDEIDSNRPSGPAPQPSSDFQKSSGSQFHLPAWVKVALLVAAVALASLGALKKYFRQNLPAPEVAMVDPDDVANRTPIQDFSVTDASGAQKKLSDFKGNVVILSFWASWCTPCLVELPTFAEIQKRFEARGLKILAVNVDDDSEEGKRFAREFWAKKEFPFGNFFDPQKSVAQQFEVDMLPSNFVIDRAGRLVFSGFGANDWNSGETIEFIEQLLQEK
ncbi:MAG: TlpA disulfide reductase family protein, partial [Bdellovibrionota bacterium]